MINSVQSYDKTPFQARLNVTDKSCILSQNNLKRLQKLAKGLAASSDEINVTILPKNRVYIDNFGNFKNIKDPSLRVKNKFDGLEWEDTKPDAFLRDEVLLHRNSTPQERELLPKDIVFFVLKDYLQNFAEYNSDFISKTFKRIHTAEIKEPFKMSSNIEDISFDNINRLVKLYRKYQEGMHQHVDEDALKNFIEKLIDNKNKIFVISEKGVPCGFLHFSVSHSTIDMTPFTTLQSLFVDSAYRQKGFAKRLLDEVARWTEFMDFKGISVKTQAKNPASVGLYSKEGFISEENKYAMFFRPNERILDYKKGYVNTADEAVKGLEEVK